MSKTRWLDENSESPEFLRALFERLAAGAEPHTAHEIWQAMLRDLWLQAEAKRRALRFVRSAGLGEHLAEDLAQETLLMFLAKLKADPSLHANADLLPHKFEAWLGTILEHLLVDVAHKLSVHRPPHETLDDEDLAVEHDFQAEERAAVFTAALAKLKGKERSVMMLHLDGLKLTVIAEQLCLTYKEAIGALKRAKSKLRKWLADYRYDK